MSAPPPPPASRSGRPLRFPGWGHAPTRRGALHHSGPPPGAFTARSGGVAVCPRHPVAAKPFAALSVASLVSRMPPSRGKEILPLLRSSARKVEAALTPLTDLPNE